MVIKNSNTFYEIFHCKTERKYLKNISCEKFEIPRFSPFQFIPLGHQSFAYYLLCRLRSIAAHRDHFVRRLSVCACICLSDSHTSPHIGITDLSGVVCFFIRLEQSVFNYPRATLLWFRGSGKAAVVPSVCPWVDLMNAIESTPLHISLSNLEDMLTMMRGCTLLILEVRGQRSRSQWTSMEISFWTQ